MARKPLFTRRTYTAADLVRLHIRALPLPSLFKFLLALSNSLMPLFTIVGASGFIDTALAIHEGTAVFADAVPYIAVLIAVMAFGHLYGVLWQLNDIAITNGLLKICKHDLAAIRGQIAYRHIENQETQDLITRMANITGSSINGMYWHILSLMQLAVQLCGILALLLAELWWAVPIMLLFCVPIIVISLRAGRKKYEADKAVTKLDRAANHFSEVLTSRENIDERFLFHYVDELDKRYLKAYDTARIHRKNREKKNMIAQKTSSVLMIAATGAMALPLVTATIRGDITVGLAMSLIPAFYNLSNQLSWNLGQFLSNLNWDFEFLKDFTAFMALETIPDPEALPSSPPLPFEHLEFRNVSFRYPGTERYILKNLSLIIEKGRHYAIVGENGAGKTTLTKLITGLYDEYDGEILVNGQNLRTFDSGQIKSLCAVVFQDFARYNLSLGENVLLGDIGSLTRERDTLRKSQKPPKGRKHRDEVFVWNTSTDFESHYQDTQSSQKLGDAAALLGLDEAIRKLPQGADTPLGKLREGGQDLSGGEWQRVAMARAVVSPAELKILDEPTAALDPISESRVYREFEAISGGNTTLFISHRLGSTKLADTIFVIGEGRVLEQGSHSDLMEQNGRYAEMYASQAQWYVD